MKRILVILFAILFLLCACSNSEAPPPTGESEDFATPAPSAVPTPVKTPPPEPAETPYELPGGLRHITFGTDKFGNAHEVYYDLYRYYYKIDAQHIDDCYTDYFDLSVEDCYDGLISGELDIIITLYEEEYIEEAEKKGVPLELRPIGVDAVVFQAICTRKSEDGGITGVKTEGGITSDEVRKMYFSKYGEYYWADTSYRIYPLEGSATTLEWLGEEAWGPSVIMWKGKIYDNPWWYMQVNLAEGVAITPNTLSLANKSPGYGRVLSINGVYPSAETILDGSYPYGVTYYAIIRADEAENSTARTIAGLLSSPERAEHMKRGLIPLIY